MTGRARRAGLGGHLLLRLAPVLLVVAPFAVAAGRALSGSAGLMFAGDQALIGLDVHDAARFEQLVGPYSRYGWAHPGPFWFYLLAPVQQLGGNAAALVAAVAVVNALFAAALVLVVARRSTVLAWVATALVLGLVLRLPAEFLVVPWNPFALLLPTALFLVLGAAAAAGGAGVWLWTAVVGSFLVQTHVGTVPLVASVLVVTAAAARRRPRPDRGHRAPRRHLAAPTAVLLTVWAPPVAQQLAAAPGPGNLIRIAAFFLHPTGEVATHRSATSVAAVTRVLAMAPLGRGPGPLEVPTAVTVPWAALTVLFLQAAAAAGLVVAGRRHGLTRPAALGALVLVALVAGLLAARSASGPLYWYLIVWVGALPLCTLLGYAALVVALVDRRRPSRTLRGGALAVSTAVAVALTVGASLSLHRGVAAVPDSPGVHAGLPLADRAVGGRTALTLRLSTHDLWPVAVGLADELTGRGHRVLVDGSLTDLVGGDRLADRPEGPVLVLTAAEVPSGGRLLGRFDTELGPAALYLLPP